MARPATALTPSSGDSRSDQSLRLMNAMPLFCPLPPKLKPCTVNSESTVAFSSSRKCRSTRSMTFMVRSCVAPTGVCTMEKRKPWSSEGRKEVGSRANSTPISTTMAAKTSMKRQLPREHAPHRPLVAGVAPVELAVEPAEEARCRTRGVPWRWA